MWREEGFLGNFNAAADAFGFDNLDMAWALAGAIYDSADDRDALFAELNSEAWPLIVHEELSGETP